MPIVLGRKEGSESGKEGYTRGEPVVKNAERVYYVLADTINDTEATILATSGIPAKGASLYGGFVNSREAREVSTVLHPSTHVLTSLWEVTCTSDSTVGDGTPPQPDGGGSDADSVKVRWSAEKETKLLTRDVITGKRVCNTVGEPLHAEYSIVHPVLEIERYELYPFDPSTIYTYVNSICDGEFWGAPDGDALMDDIKVDEYEEAGYILNIITYRIKFWSGINAVPEIAVLSPWQLSLLNQGTMYKKEVYDEELPGFVDEIVRAEDESGNPITVNLTLDGHILPPNADPLLDAVWLPFNRYRKRNWDALNIHIEQVLGL